MFITVLLPLAAQAATPATPPLNTMQQGALTCSAAFALEAARPNTPAEQARRGREFFVRSMARIMDDTGADRDAVVALIGAEARRLAAEPGALDEVLPACRDLLAVSGIE